MVLEIVADEEETGLNDLGRGMYRKKAALSEDMDDPDRVNVSPRCEGRVGSLCGFRVRTDGLVEVEFVLPPNQSQLSRNWMR